MGWGGYGSLSNTSLEFGFMAPNVSWADANSTIHPFFDYALNATNDPNATATTEPYANFYALLNTTNSAGGQDPQVGGLIEIASRLLSRDAAEQRPEETAQVLLSLEGVGIKCANLFLKQISNSHLAFGE